VDLKEKTIAFYKSLRTGCTAPGQHAEIDRIIAEEERHKSKMEALREHQWPADGSGSPP
jgi:hypothetical protein